MSDKIDRATANLRSQHDEAEQKADEKRWEEQEIRTKALECACRTANWSQASSYVDMAKEFEQYLKGE